MKSWRQQALTSSFWKKHNRGQELLLLFKLFANLLPMHSRAQMTYEGPGEHRLDSADSEFLEGRRWTASLELINKSNNCKKFLSLNMLRLTNCSEYLRSHPNARLTHNRGQEPFAILVIVYKFWFASQKCMKFLWAKLSYVFDTWIKYPFRKTDFSAWLSWSRQKKTRRWPCQYLPVFFYVFNDTQL